MKAVHKIGLLAALLGFMAGMAGEARAYTFDFQDVYYISSASAFNTAFAGNTGPGYSTSGYYQRTEDASGGGVIARRLGSVSSVPGAYVDNTAINASQYLSFTGGSWYGAGTVLNGSPIGSVYNTADTGNGGSLYFQYRLGTTAGSGSSGTVTPFTFNSFSLRGNSSVANYTFTLEGLDALGHVLFTDTLHVIGNTLTTFTENWAGVTTVMIPTVGTSGGGIGIGGLYMDNVEINDPIAAPVPEPGTMVLLGAGMLGLGLYGKRRTHGKKA